MKEFHYFNQNLYITILSSVKLLHDYSQKYQELIVKVTFQNPMCNVIISKQLFSKARKLSMTEFLVEASCVVLSYTFSYTFFLRKNRRAQLG